MNLSLVKNELSHGSQRLSTGEPRKGPDDGRRHSQLARAVAGLVLCILLESPGPLTGRPGSFILLVFVLADQLQSGARMNASLCGAAAHRILHETDNRRENGTSRTASHHLPNDRTGIHISGRQKWNELSEDLTANTTADGADNGVGERCRG